MLLTHFTNEKELARLARELEVFAKPHGLKSRISFRPMSDGDFNPDSQYVQLMGYAFFRKELILWIEELERYDNLVLETALRALNDLTPEEQNEPGLKDALVRELLLPLLSRTIAHEIKHQIDDDRQPWLFRVSNYWACLWKHPFFHGRFLGKPLLLLYRFSPIELRANRYARRYAEDYKQILRRYL